MGTSGSKDIVHDVSNKSLDISHHLTPDQYKRHVEGECLEQCLLELPWEMYYNTVTMYEDVDASFNFIGSIPTELALHVPHLRQLNLSHNQLPSLPASFQLLLHLRTLYLSHNRIKQFPACIVRLPHLHTLDVSHNSLKDLPQHCWKHMPALEKLNLSHNQLHLLPNSMSGCNKLRVLVVTGNPLMHPPLNVCDEGCTAILAYLRRQHIDKEKPRAPLSGGSSPVFCRVRGDHVSASVSNPESAWRQYQQGSYTGPGSKRKCPMMPPKDATALPPHSITQALMGLIYGGVLGESVGLSCEGLSNSETQFHYTVSSLGPHARLRDRLRSHYPPGDWGPQADLMVITLESVLRWGGVVDELEWAAQVHQWTIHGLTDVDDRPGVPVSPLLERVFSSEGYGVSPYVAAESLYRQLTLEPGVRRSSAATDSFVITDRRSSGAIASDTPPLHPNDNSCLSAALVLGLPSFSQRAEVRSNAERICRATHAAPVPRAAGVMVAGTVAAVMQGRFEPVKSNPSLMEPILEDLFTESMQQVPESLEKATLLKVWQGDLRLKDSGLPSSHVAYTLVYLKRALLRYSKSVWQASRPNSGQFDTNASSPGSPVKHSNDAKFSVVTEDETTVPEELTTNDAVASTTQQLRVMSRMLSDGELPSSYTTSDQTQDVNRRRTVSLQHPSNIKIHLNDDPLPDDQQTSGGGGNSIGNDNIPAQEIPLVDARGVYKKLVGEMCLQGGWGMCAHACVVGGVLGALGGYNKLPHDWLKQLAPPNQRYLNGKVNLLLDMFGLP